MSRVPPTASPVRTVRRKNVSLAFTGAMLLVLLAAGLAQAVAVSAASATSPITAGLPAERRAIRPQSKLWFANNKWYGGLFKSGANANQSHYNIYGYDAVTHVWTDTGIVVDPRDRTHADYLFVPGVGANGKLYVATTKSSCTSIPRPAPAMTRSGSTATASFPPIR